MQHTQGVLSSFKSNTGRSSREGISVYRDAQYINDEYTPYKPVAHFEFEGEMDYDEAWANALLFMAAPDMLAALKAYITWLDEDNAPDPEPMIRAALSKVAGKTP